MKTKIGSDKLGLVTDPKVIIYHQEVMISPKSVPLFPRHAHFDGQICGLNEGDNL